MKKYTQILIVTLLVIGGIQTVQAKTTTADIDAQVKAFYQKSYTLYECSGTWDVMSISIGMYKDSSGKIRMIRKQVHLDGSTTFMAFYDEEGELMLYCIGWGLGYTRMYFNKGKILQSEGEKDDSYTKFLIASDYEVEAQFSEISSEMASKGEVSFSPLAVENWTYTLGVNVNVRATADTKAKVVGTLDTLDWVKILEVGKKEKIGSFGDNYWYKVSYWTINPDSLEPDKEITGWVYGAFLLPKENLPESEE